MTFYFELREFDEFEERLLIGDISKESNNKLENNNDTTIEEEKEKISIIEVEEGQIASTEETSLDKEQLGELLNRLEIIEEKENEEIFISRRESNFVDPPPVSEVKFLSFQTSIKLQEDIYKEQQEQDKKVFERKKKLENYLNGLENSKENDNNNKFSIFSIFTNKKKGKNDKDLRGENNIDDIRQKIDEKIADEPLVVQYYSPIDQISNDQFENLEISITFNLQLRNNSENEKFELILPIISPPLTTGHWIVDRNKLIYTGGDFKRSEKYQIRISKQFQTSNGNKLQKKFQFEFFTPILSLISSNFIPIIPPKFIFAFCFSEKISEDRFLSNLKLRIDTKLISANSVLQFTTKEKYLSSIQPNISEIDFNSPFADNCIFIEPIEPLNYSSPIQIILKPNFRSNIGSQSTFSQIILYDGLIISPFSISEYSLNLDDDNDYYYFNSKNIQMNIKNIEHNYFQLFKFSHPVIEETDHCIITDQKYLPILEDNTKGKWIFLDTDIICFILCKRERLKKSNLIRITFPQSYSSLYSSLDNPFTFDMKFNLMKISLDALSWKREFSIHFSQRISPQEIMNSIHFYSLDKNHLKNKTIAPRFLEYSHNINNNNNNIYDNNDINEERYTIKFTSNTHLRNGKEYLLEVGPTFKSEEGEALTNALQSHSFIIPERFSIVFQQSSINFRVISITSTQPINLDQFQTIVEPNIGNQFHWNLDSNPSSNQFVYSSNFNFQESTQYRIILPATNSSQYNEELGEEISLNIDPVLNRVLQSYPVTTGIVHPHQGLIFLFSQPIPREEMLREITCTLNKTRIELVLDTTRTPQEYALFGSNIPLHDLDCVLCIVPRSGSFPPNSLIKLQFNRILSTRGPCLGDPFIMCFYTSDYLKVTKTFNTSYSLYLQFSHTLSFSQQDFYLKQNEYWRPIITPDILSHDVDWVFEYPDKISLSSATKKFEDSTRYTVTVPRCISDFQDMHLNEDHVFSFVTTLLTVRRVIPSEGMISFTPTFVIEFNQPVDPLHIIQFIRFTGPKNRLIELQLKENVNINPETSQQFLSFSPSSNLHTGSNYQLVIPPGLSSLLGPELSTQNLVYEYKTDKCFRCKLINSSFENNIINSNNRITIEFSSSILLNDNGELDESLLPKISPNIAGTFSYSSGTIHFTPINPWPKSTRYTIFVSKKN